MRINLFPVFMFKSLLLHLLDLVLNVYAIGTNVGVKAGPEPQAGLDDEVGLHVVPGLVHGDD